MLKVRMKPLIHSGVRMNRKEKAGNPFPAKIRHVAVFAPASPARPEQVKAAVAVMKAWGIRVTVMPSATAPVADPGGRSAAHAARLADLQAGLADRSVDLLWCVRGGYGAVQLLEHIDWKLLAARNLPILGYSDITGLLLAMRAHQAGRPVAAPVFVELPELIVDPWSLDSFRRTFAGTAAAQPLTLPPGVPRCRVIRDGTAAGPLIPANLAMLCALLGTPHLPDLRGAVLLLEDLNEPAYKLDRMLTQLAQAGILGGCAALLFGSFRRCGTLADRRAIFAKFAAAVPPRGPVLADFPFGHAFPRLTMRVGQTVRISHGGVITLG